MESHNTSKRAQLFALIDGAANPASIHPILETSGVDFKSVYEGLPEEKLGAAALFLAQIDDPDADWVMELDQIDRYSPCLSLVWGRVGLVDLAAHLRAFLFADIGNGMTALVRFFDPRNTQAVFDVWGEALQIIVVGDGTSHEGRVISGSETHTIDGKRIARLFDLVDCPQKYPDGRPHGINKIIEAHPTFTIGEKRVALHGHRTECGCTLIGSRTATIGD